jgi:hypothetical protein
MITDRARFRAVLTMLPREPVIPAKRSHSGTAAVADGGA